MPRDILAEAIDALHTADHSAFTLKLSAPQARAILKRIDYLERDNQTLRQQHAAWHSYARAERGQIPTPDSAGNNS